MGPLCARVVIQWKSVLSGTLHKHVPLRLHASALTCAGNDDAGLPLGHGCRRHQRPVPRTYEIDDSRVVDAGSGAWRRQRSPSVHSHPRTRFIHLGTSVATTIPVRPSPKTGGDSLSSSLIVWCVCFACCDWLIYFAQRDIVKSKSTTKCRFSEKLMTQMFYRSAFCSLDCKRCITGRCRIRSADQFCTPPLLVGAHIHVAGHPALPPSSPPEVLV